ncbi:YCF48-related protein [Salmonirosea aquatica]|uniref:YCF48-related protein n=1 Tax=Salmonirosea aquatica TaxID=2654236 RepID=UPI0035712640
MAHYTFNGTFSDQTANANHAQASGNPGFVPDRKGVANRAVGLGGCASPQFLRVPHSASLQMTGAMSVSFWALVDLSSGMDPGTGACNANGRHVFFAKGGDGFGGSPPGVQGLTYQQNGLQQVSFESATNAGQYSVMSARPLPGNSWHYYTYTITNSQFRLYVDAQLVRTLPVSIDFTQVNQQDLFLGVMGPKSPPVLGITNWYPLKGALDDVKVFNRELTLQEVAALYYSDDSGNCTPSVSVLPSGNQTICEIQPLTLKNTSSLTDVQWQWLKNSQPIAQATLDSLVVNQVGSYRLEATRRTSTWKHAMEGLDNTLNDVQFVGNTGWIVGEYATLLKTTDGGTTWDTIPMNREDTFYDVHFINAQTGWIGGANGLLLKSIDGGLSWSQQYIPITGDVRKIQFLSETTGYALGNGQLLKSTDGGISWAGVAAPTTNLLVDLTFGSVNTGWIITNDQLFKTTDGGTSWFLQKSSLPSPCQFSSFQKIFALNPDSCWVTYYSSYCEGKAVSRTTNGGTTWTDYSIDVPGSSYRELSYLNLSDLVFTDAQTGYITGTLYSRTTAQYGITGGVVFKSQDGGQTWTSIYVNYFNVQPKAVAFAAPSRGVVVGAGGLYLSTVTNFAPHRTYLPLKSVGGTTQKIISVGGKFKPREDGAHPDSKAVTLTSSNGSDWTKEETGSGNGVGNTLSQVKFKNSQFGWKVGYFTLSTTHDGGNSWQSLLAPGPPSSFNYIVEKAYFTGDTTGFCLLRTHFENSAAGLIAFSGSQFVTPPVYFKDGGDPSNTGLLDLQFINDRTGFITTSNGKLIKTTDGGATWNVLLVQAHARLNRCYFVTDQIGWVVGENGLIMKTTNGGQSWTNQTSGQSATWNGIYFLSALEGYVVGAEGTLVKTSDGGNSWVTVVTNTHQNLNDITFITPDKGFIVGDYGVILTFNPTLLPACKTTSAAVNVSVTSGEVCESSTSGSWDNLATWNCGHIPRVCDQIVINPGHVVQLGQSVQVRGIEIRQNGQLSMQGKNALLQN